MDNDEIAMKGYLQAVYDSTQGDPEIQVSMHEVGIPLGYDKAESGRMAEELMVSGYIELRTLAGGICLTASGLDYLGVSTAATPTNTGGAQLSGEPVITEGDKKIIDGVGNAIKKEIVKQELDYAAVEQAVLDLKTIDLHLLSPAPKTAVILELFRSVETALEANKAILESSGLSAILQPSA